MITTDYVWPNKVALIVEDDTSSLMLLEAILGKTGISIFVVDNGEKAVDFVLQGNPVDIVLMDIKLKGISGLEATKLIKKINPKIPIIAQTACAVAGDMERCLDAGCNAYIPKPISTKVLLDTIDYYMKEDATQELLKMHIYNN
ncbi:MAG: response regulator [Tenuifilaceae bacterium]|nr:response regulator [Tenuifilaceae bacterium]